jgi:hypothetical protein
MHFEKDENLVEAIRASRLTYVKLLKVAWGVWHWTLKSNKRNQAKEMDAISKYHDSKIFMGGIFHTYIFHTYIVCILTLEFILLFCFFVLGFGAQ